MLLLLSMLATELTLAQSCSCLTDEKGFVFKKKISVCGTPEERTFNNSLVLSELTVKSCLNDRYLIDSRLDASETFAVQRFADSVIITDLLTVPDSTMLGLVFVPLSYKTVKVEANGKIRLSPSRFIFTIPTISENQRTYIRNLCLKLKAGIKRPAAVYPADEISLYALFLGALAKCEDCRDLFLNLDKYYILDGAIAETKAEIPFEYIRKNIR